MVKQEVKRIIILDMWESDLKEIGMDLSTLSKEQVSKFRDLLEEKVIRNINFKEILKRAWIELS